MAIPIFVQQAQDPTLIQGIYETCDQWCMYCPATARCLAYRCQSATASGSRPVSRTLADRLFEGLIVLKQLCDAEGRPTPELDALLADDPRKRAHLFEVDDPLERMGRRYAALCDAYLTSRPDFPFEMKRRDSGPTPLDVLAWFHALVPAKVYRALVSAREAARGDVPRRDDALKSAKVALVGIDRSLEALAAMAEEDDDPRLDLLRAHLRRFRRDVEGRFPEARNVVRSGLDSPARE